jgi:hypothetical protein
VATRRQAPKRDRVTVPDADSMLAQPFRLHCQLRHPNLGFWSKGEHIADHRLHDDRLDHVHKAKKEVAEDVDGVAEPGQQDQGTHT